MKTANFPIISAQSLTASSNSTPISLDQVCAYSIQVILTGTPVGSLKLQVSNDPPTLASPAPVYPTNWTDVTTSVTAVSGATTLIFEDPSVTYEWVRVVYTASSSTGSMSARMKTIGV